MREVSDEVVEAVYDFLTVAQGFWVYVQGVMEADYAVNVASDWTYRYDVQNNSAGLLLGANATAVLLRLSLSVDAAGGLVRAAQQPVLEW